MAGHSFNPHRCKTFQFLLFCLLPVFLLWGCGGDTPEQGTTDNLSTASTDTGSASFAVQWHTAETDQTSAVARQAIESCETAGVASITCNVYGDPSQDPIATGGPWDCDAHHGTIEGIPAGSNRTFGVLGWSDPGGDGDAIYQGQSASITIVPNQTINVGTIDARPFVPDAPTVVRVYGNRIELSWGDLGVARYRIYRNGAVVGNSSSNTYADTGLSTQTQYCYTISALDNFGNESAQSGRTCATTTLLSIWYLDSDEDTYGDPANSTESDDQPAGYVGNDSDCDDSNGAIHPGATEILDGVDNNCDGNIDEGFNTYYRDADNDNFGNPEDSIQAASQPTGYVTNNTDCDDGNGAVHPGADESCNGIDDNCVGGIDENLTRPTTCGVGACAGNTGTETCTAGVWGNDTCNPTAGAGSEVCDNVDNDCDGSVDENLIRATTCGVGACAGNTGSQTCTAGVWGADTCDPTSGASKEVCDDVDNDCDSEIDEGLRFRDYYADSDHDNYGNPNDVINECQQPAGYILDNTDCNDNDPNINPGAREVCFDGIDNNCDGVRDNNCDDINPTSSFTARYIGGQNVLVGDANDKEGQAFNSAYLYIKEGTSDRTCLEFNITSQPVPRRVTLEFDMRNMDVPTYSYITVIGYLGNGLANAADYFNDDSNLTLSYINTFSDYGASGTNHYSIDVTDAYLSAIKREGEFLGILLRADDTNARYDVYSPVLTLSY